MRRALLAFGILAIAASGTAAVFEKFLSESNPSDRAIIAFMELDKSGKASSDDLAELGVLLLEKGFPKDAERYLERAIDLDPKNAEARFRLGLVLQRMGENRRAARVYKRVIKDRPGLSYAQFMLATALERSGKRDAAIYHYAKAYKHNPDLANPAKNPLVLDSRLQTEAQLLRYRREVAAQTIHVPSLDPERLKQMMAAHQQAAPAPTPVAPAAPAPTPTPVPSPRPTEASSVAPAPGPVPPQVTPPAGQTVAPGVVPQGAGAVTASPTRPVLPRRTYTRPVSAEPQGPAGGPGLAPTPPPSDQAPIGGLVNVSGSAALRRAAAAVVATR